MTDYSKLSDDEINSRVAETLPIRFTYYSDYIWNTEEECRFDPCDNPSDAWPIILNNRISMVWDCAEDPSAEWWNAVAQFDECSIQYQSNPLRAAMIVYLMMKESENEN